MATKKRFSGQNGDKYPFGWDLPVKWEEGDIAGGYPLPEVGVYPNNRFGDIARSQGLETARNWRKVKEGTTAGINRFASPVTGGAMTAVSFSPAGDAIDAVDFYNAAMKGDGMGMALAGLGFIPVVGNVAKKAGKYGKAALRIAAEEASDKAYGLIGKYVDNKYIRPVLKKADEYFEKHPMIDKEALEFYEKDVIPRAKKYQGVDFHISPDMFEYRYKLLDMDGKFGFNITGNGIENGKTYIRIRPNDGTLVHEIRHASQLKNKNKPNNNGFYDVLSEKSEKKLNSTYMPRNPDDAGGYAKSVVEKEANNTEMRYLLWKRFKQQFGRTPSVEELDKMIDSVNGERLYNELYSKSAYMDSYLNNMIDMGMAKEGAGNFIKGALKYVPVIGGAALVLPYQSSNNKNKGRFDYEQ